MVMLIVGITAIYAAGYDLNKFSGFAKQRYGEEAYNTTLELQQLLNQLKSASEADKLKEINNFFNRKVTYASELVAGALITRSMPQIVHLPGLGDLMCGCIGQR